MNANSSACSIAVTGVTLASNVKFQAPAISSVPRSANAEDQSGYAPALSLKQACENAANARRVSTPQYGSKIDGLRLGPILRTSVSSENFPVGEREDEVGPRVLPPTNENTTAMPVSAVPPLRVTKSGAVSTSRRSVSGRTTSMFSCLSNTRCAIVSSYKLGVMIDI